MSKIPLSKFYQFHNSVKMHWRWDFCWGHACKEWGKKSSNVSLISLPTCLTRSTPAFCAKETSVKRGLLSARFNKSQHWPRFGYDITIQQHWSYGSENLRILTSILVLSWLEVYDCGLKTKIQTSWTDQNPSHRFHSTCPQRRVIFLILLMKILNVCWVF